MDSLANSSSSAPAPQVHDLQGVDVCCVRGNVTQLPVRKQGLVER